MTARNDLENGLRDGKEILPEPVDLPPLEPLARPPVHPRGAHKTEADIDESLEESFPASDPPASGYSD